MTIVPHRLLHEPFVEVFQKSNSLLMLKKTLQTSLVQRESYLAMHAITYVRRGQQQIEAFDGDILRINSGQLGIFKKGLYTVSDLLPLAGDFEVFLIFFNDRILQEALDMHGVVLPDEPVPATYFTADAPAYIQHFWESVIHVHSSLLNTSPTFFDIKAWELFSSLLSHSSEFASTLASLIQPQPKSLAKIMETHFDKPLGIADYAYLSGRSPATFRREFKLKYGSSPRKWITQKRMEKAAELLKDGTKTVREIAAEIGYESSSHFIQEFKKRYGYTPGQF